MKIVHCFWSFNRGGSETMLIDIMNEQAKSHDVALLIVNDYYSTELLADLSPKVKVVKANRPQGSRNPYYVLKFNMMLRWLKPDVVHLHQPNLAKYVLKPAGVPLVLTCHALNLDLRHTANVDACIAISPSVSADVSSRAQLKPVVIANGINTQAIAQRGTEEPHSPLRIVQVGRLYHEIKGQDVLIRAVAALERKHGMQASVDFIGDGPSWAVLQAMASTLGLSERVNFLGDKSRDYIYSHLADYDLMCHPARQEGFGLAVAEGLAAALPVVVPDAGEPYDLIGSGAYGYAFAAADPDACADVIALIARDYPAALGKAREGAQYVALNYSITAQAAEYVSLYDKLRQ